MQIFNLKEVFSSGYGWESGFKFEIIYSKSGVARIYVGDRKTKYAAVGYGYDKRSSVLAAMINDLVGKQPYNENIYGSRNGLLSGGVGVSSIKESFESVDGFKLNEIYSGFNGQVFEITFK